MKRFRDAKSLIKLVPDKKMIIELYLKEHDTDFSNPNEVLELLVFSM